MKPTRTLFQTFLLLTLLMAAVGNGAMAQDTVYHPFADHSVWSVNNIKYGTWGDTVICGKNYLKVYRQEEDHPFVFDVEQAEYFCAIRNDTAAQRVYGVYKTPATVYKYTSRNYPFFSIIDTATDTTEFLLYDFNLGLEDTIEIASLDEYLYAYEAPGIYVYEAALYTEENSNETMTLNDNSIRKALMVEILNWPSTYYEKRLLEWVEGIGEMEHGPVTIGRGPVDGVWEGKSLWLLCYEENGNLLLSEPQHDADLNYDCYYHVGIEDGIPQEGNIYPNPTTGIVTISLPETWSNSTSHIAIYNAKGQRIFSKPFESKEFEISLYDFSSGLYIIQVIGENKQIISKKIIKQ